MFVFVPKPKWPNNEKYLFSPLHILTPWFLKIFPVWPNSMHSLPPPVPLKVRTCARDFATLPALARIYRLIGVVYLRKGLATQISFETPDRLPPFAFDKSPPAASVGGGGGAPAAGGRFGSLLTKMATLSAPGGGGGRVQPAHLMPSRSLRVTSDTLLPSGRNILSWLAFESFCSAATTPIFFNL